LGFSEADGQQFKLKAVAASGATARERITESIGDAHRSRPAIL
jgi:hypothetical protein